MNLHSRGKEDFIKELNNKKDLEIKEVDDSRCTSGKKLKLIQKIINKFKQLINDSEQSLFLQDNV